MKVCLIGSTRFMDKYTEVNQKLTKGGHVVYSVCMASTGKPEERNLSVEAKETLDLVHLLKIQNSDCCVLITDETGYVGESTKREIKWAHMIGKQVILPNHIKGFDEILIQFQDWLKTALAEESGLNFKSKLDASKIRI